MPILSQVFYKLLQHPIQVQTTSAAVDATGRQQIIAAINAIKKINSFTETALV